MKQNNIWSKTLLYVYKYLDRIAGAVDKLVEREALNSYYTSIRGRDNSTLAVANRIIALSERKARLICVKDLIEHTLEKCQTLHAQLLIEKYIDDDSCENISTRHNLAMRTYFRRLTQAEECFYNIMTTLGYNDKKLYEYLCQEKWIMEVYENFKNYRSDEKEEDEEEL